MNLTQCRMPDLTLVMDRGQLPTIAATRASSNQEAALAELPLSSAANEDRAWRGFAPLISKTVPGIERNLSVIGTGRGGALGLSSLSSIHGGGGSALFCPCVALSLLRRNDLT